MDHASDTDLCAVGLDLDLTAVGKRVAVIGTGYVGLTCAAALAHLGNTVTAIDIDAAKIDRLRDGCIDIHEAGLEQLVSQGLVSGRLEFSTGQGAAAVADVIMLCLPTPSSTDGGLDLSYVRTAVATLRPLLSPGAVIVTKSTVPVGTAERVMGWLDRPDVAVVSNPEFLREGTAIDDFLHPDRIVIGSSDDRAAEVVQQLYNRVDAPVQLTDPRSAELIKYAANTFLATKLSFVNELSRLCDRTEADIDAVVAGLRADHRIGSAFLRPGPGWGGSCFPKDARGMDHLATGLGLDLQVVRAASASNADHFDHIHAEISQLLATPLSAATIAIWGVTFKAGTDDCRESPAIAVIERLVEAGAYVRLYDPAARPALDGVLNTDDAYAACMGADLLVVLTEWDEFADADLYLAAQLLDSPVVYDTRGVLDSEDASSAALILHRPGRSTPSLVAVS